MDGYYLKTRITKSASALLVVILLQFLNIQGINSQNIDHLDGPIIHSGKEPPDLQNIAANKQTLFSTSDRRFKERPINFLCSSRIPIFISRRNSPAQKTESPFVITVTPEVTESKHLQVRISSPEGQSFRGFMIQVLSSGPAADDNVVGEFLPSPSVNLQSCYTPDDTATSGDRARRDSAVITWKVPADLTGRIRARATVIQGNQRYWLDILSDEINLDDLPKDHVVTDVANNVPNDSGIAGENKPQDEGERGSDDVEIPINLDENDKRNLENSIAETFEDFSGPLESPDEVLLHQGIMEVDKVGVNRNAMPNRLEESGVIIKPPSFDTAPLAPLPPPQYIYRTMNRFAPDFEPPHPSEFVGNLIKGALLGGGGPTGGGGGNGLGSMMNMMNMASSMMGGGGGGGGGMMNSLGTISKLSGMLGGGGMRPPSSQGGLGGLGSLGALSSLGSMFGGGGPVRNTAAPPRQGGSGFGGLGALSSLLGGIGNRNNQVPPGQNVAPPPSGGPVNPAPRDEPSLADLLGVDPNVALDSTPLVVPAEANPLAGITAAKAGGGIMSKIGGFAPMLALAPIALNMFGGKKKKQQQQMPFGQQGQFGAPGMQGMPGMPPGAQGQFGMPGAPPGQFGRPGQGQGQFGMPPPQQGQFGGQFGMPQQNMGGLFGPTQAPTKAPAKDGDIQQILKLLESQRLQIDALKTQISGSSITNQMGGFGNIPLSIGQTTGSQLLGLADSNGFSTLGTSLSTFEPIGPPKQIIQPSQTSSSQDMLLQELLRQNQMLMQQNQQFQTSMLTANRGQGQFGSQASTIGRVNRSNAPPVVNNVVPGGAFGQNFGQSNFPQNNFPQNSFPQTQNTGVTNGFMPGNPMAPAGSGTFGGGAQNGFGSFTGTPGVQTPPTGSTSMFGQFGGANNGPQGGAPPFGSNNAPPGGAPPFGTNNVPSGGAPPFGANNGGMMGNQGGSTGGGGLADMFGGGAGSIGPGPGKPPGGGQSGLGGQGGTPPGGGGGGLPDIGSLMGNLDTSALQGMLGGGGPGGMDVSSLLGSVDMDAMQGLLGGDQGQDLMNSVSGMLSGPNGGNLMNAVNGMMSGNGNPADIAGLMGSMDVGELQNMAQQAESIMASSGINPAQILSMMGK